MSKQYGAKVTTYKHPQFGTTIDIRFDKTSGYFHAEYADVHFKADKLSDIRANLVKAIESNITVEWRPVITISFPRSWGDGEPRVAIEYERHWFAQTIDEKWVKADWDTKVYKDPKKRPLYHAKDRMQESKHFAITRYDHGETIELPFGIPFTDREDSETPTFYVAHTEELWNMLEGLTKAISTLQKRLIKALGSEKNRQQLIANMIGRMLPPAPKGDE